MQHKAIRTHTNTNSNIVEVTNLLGKSTIFPCEYSAIKIKSASMTCHEWQNRLKIEDKRWNEAS